MMKIYLKYVFFSFGYLVLLIASIYFSSSFFGSKELVSSFDFLRWDALHFSQIASDGYNPTTTAFYPGFPYLWRFLGCSAFVISISNFGFFSIGLSILLYELKLKFSQVVLILPLPSMLFMFLPYSEALVFLFGAVFLVGLNQKNILLQCIGLFMMSVTKPTAAVFIPGILLAEFVLNDNYRIYFKRTGVLVLTLIVANFLVYLFQFLETGAWFTFFSSQIEWGNKIQWPVFPLGTWNHNVAIWVDAPAFLISSLSGIVLIYLLVLKWKGGSIGNYLMMYSLAYLAGTGLFVLLFRGGQLFSLNRFVFATPFLFAGMNAAANLVDRKFIGRAFFILVGFFSLLSLLFGSYQHIKLIVSYSILSLVTSWWIFAMAGKIKPIMNYLLAIALFIAQVYYGWILINNSWLA